MKILLINIIFIVWMSNLLIAQNQIVEKTTFFFTNPTCTVVLDEMSIVPSSLVITDVENQKLINYKLQNNKIVFDSTNCRLNSGRQLIATFKTFGFNIEKTFVSDKLETLKSHEKVIQSFDISDPRYKKNSIIDSENINYNGSFARGFSVGNSQDLILNSNFNLSIAGEIGEGMILEAAISDDNIPIQPEGNTQLIQDFDRVYIKIKKDSTSLIAGDYSLNRPISYFININKKLKGLSLTNTSKLPKNSTLTTNGNFAISRGKFARQNLQISEGNHGPYRLTGNNNERFIIILSGTEKLYLDGALLKRGLDYDYVIDYNRAEITFTATRFIGRESRIIVEYEYRDQNYLRTLYSANVGFQSKKLTTNFSFYTEQDSKNTLGDIELDSLDFFRLQNIGDNLEDSYVSGIRVPLDTLSSKITYTLISNPDPADPNPQILLYETDSNLTLYHVTFTEVGESGSYSIDNDNVVNGRVYKYVGTNNGLYDPIIKLVPPEKRQMISVNADYKIDSKSQLFTELSLSNTDLNRYSDFNNNDNQGWAGIIKLDRKFYLDSLHTRYLHTAISHEKTDMNFSPLNPYRTPEFRRDWNFNLETLVDDNISEAEIGYKGSKNFDLSYKFSQYNAKDLYQGKRNIASANYKLNKFQVTPTFDYLTTEDLDRTTSFLRPKLTITQDLLKKRPLRLSFRYQEEKNSIHTKEEPESLATESRQFILYNYSIRQKINSFFSYDLSYSNRLDLLPDGQIFAKAIESKEYLAKSTYVHPHHQFSFNMGVRNSDVIRADLATSNKSKFTTISKINYNLNLLKGGIRGNLVFNSTSGQEPKLEYIYERVEQGQGSYIYIGNPDSILIQANFRYAPDLGTGEYIRINQYNNEYINTQNTDLSQSFNIDFSKMISKKDSSNFKRFIGRFSTGVTARVSKKTSNDDAILTDQIDIFTIDTSIVTYRSSTHNFIIFNKGNRKNDFKIGKRRNKNISTQISEKEERTLDELYFTGRIKLYKTYDFIFHVAKGVRNYTSQLFASRNYVIDYQKISPSLSIRPSASFRIIAGYEYEKRAQNINLLENAISHSINTEITFRRSNLSNLSVKLDLVNVTYEGEENSIIEFDLLEGLKNGRNYIWNTQYIRRLKKNIDLTFSYQGRNNVNSRTIHIGRVQVKATF